MGTSDGKILGTTKIVDNWPNASRFNLVIMGDGYQSGHAFTAAWMFEVDPHWRLALEWLRVRSYSENREELGGAPFLTETQLQLAVRYALGPAAR